MVRNLQFSPEIGPSASITAFLESSLHLSPISYLAKGTTPALLIKRIGHTAGRFECRYPSIPGIRELSVVTVVRVEEMKDGVVTHGKN